MHTTSTSIFKCKQYTCNTPYVYTYMCAHVFNTFIALSFQSSTAFEDVLNSYLTADPDLLVGMRESQDLTFSASACICFSFAFEPRHACSRPKTSYVLWSRDSNLWRWWAGHLFTLSLRTCLASSTQLPMLQCGR